MAKADPTPDVPGPTTMRVEVRELWGLAWKTITLRLCGASVLGMVNASSTNADL
jgi:hypothetical protein